MSFLLTLDPGSRGCGVALFEQSSRELVRAAYVKGQGVEGGLGADNAYYMAKQVYDWVTCGQSTYLPSRIALMAVEVPKVYGAEAQKGDQNDLVPLALVVGCLVGLIHPAAVHQYFPRDWKGTIDGDHMVRRVIDRLSHNEKLRCEKCPASLAHNMFDAVGIGLKYLGRLEKIRTYDKE